MQSEWSHIDENAEAPRASHVQVEGNSRTRSAGTERPHVSVEPFNARAQVAMGERRPQRTQDPEVSGQWRSRHPPRRRARTC